MLDASGNLYGTTYQGGTGDSFEGNTIVQLRNSFCSG
jgi:hypothetical protein